MDGQDCVSMHVSGEPPLSREPAVEAPIVENADTTQQTNIPVGSGQKRKQVESRSKIWEHFVKIFDEKGVLVKGKCIYCARVYCCHSKKHGTSSIRNHMLSCLKNTHSKDTRQVLLTYQPITAAIPTEEPTGVLGTWVFDQTAIRRALAEMHIIDELPFRFVDRQGFRKFMSIACPRFKIPSRWTIARDIYQIYLDEKLNLKRLFRETTQRVSITTDTWTSVQRINYMCITAHYIDHQWKLQKKIISFVQVTSHKGEYIAKALENCLLEWGLKNIFTVTVDNASSNDTAVGFFKKKLLSWGASSVKVQYLHMRCIAHILNLAVQDGLKQADTSLSRVRGAVKYVRNSPARLQKFKDISDLIGVEAKCGLHLDVPTRWNSTYLMLKSALCNEKVFEAYEENVSSYSVDLGLDTLDTMDWISCESMVTVLQNFYEMTLRISGSLYVTSNTFFSEVSDLFLVLQDLMKSDRPSTSSMGSTMKSKLDKYWGDPEKMNFLIFFANVLDPRDKFEYLPFQLNALYTEKKGEKFFESIKVALTELFSDYVSNYTDCVGGSSESSSTPAGLVIYEEESARPVSKFKAQLKKQKLESG
ncbi:unnamed protein product [Cuscuta epithymum]|uniref:BED-type domain-containing protein n=1 Tax=Cuscuta epithymum TaxID=186058 RepID=A0AAV0E4Q0_9ASTE|nr:unnamed protein product [Cuscuta epithymum]CAH9147352.1 unnamed protein product [Cuscuta epithymum]